MGIPKPKYNLDIGSGLHGDTTGRMLAGIEKVILDEKPDWLLVYGDTNSTLAGALAAAKLHVPVAHVEAGLRSFNKRMPEEINRILTDHVSSLLFCPTTTAVENLKNESISQGVHHVGDVMYDAALYFGEIADSQSHILSTLNLTSKGYYLATVHRAENTDDQERLKGIFAAFNEIATEECPIVLPLHPRTRAVLIRNGIVEDRESWIGDRGWGIGDRELAPEPRTSNPNLYFIQPVSFLDMVKLEKHAKVILTDSGGVQKEAYFHEVPCITLRDETEWVETVEAGWNVIVGADVGRIGRAVWEVENGPVAREYLSLFGDGDAANFVCTIITRRPQARAGHPSEPE